MDSGDAARRLVPGPEVGPDLAPVLTDLAHHPANLGAVGERLELADQGGTFGPVQLRGQRGQDVLGDTEGRFTGKAGCRERAEGRRQRRS